MGPEIWSLIEFFIILDHFLHLYPPNKPKNQKFEKMKKRLYISSFYSSIPKIMITCYSVSEIQHVMDVIFIFHFGLIVCLFTPLTTQKNQNFEKMKNTLKDIIILHMHTKKWCKTIERTDIPIEKVTYKGGCPT